MVITLIDETELVNIFPHTTIDDITDKNVKDYERIVWASNRLIVNFKDNFKILKDSTDPILKNLILTSFQEVMAYI